VPCSAKPAQEMITLRAWKRTKLEDISLVERCTCRKVLKETSRMSVRKPKCGPRNSRIKLISKRLAARMPAFTSLGNLKLRQKEWLLIYTSWIKTSTRVHRP